MSTEPSGDRTESQRKAVLLRGINVGKAARIAMSDLKACTESAGGADVKTFLATGNLLVTDPRPLPELRAVLEAAYADRFGYDAVVQVLTREALEAAVESYPFDTLEEHHDYVVFSDDPVVTSRVAQAMRAGVDATGGASSSTEAVAEGLDCVYWRVPRGSTLTSEPSKVLDRRENKRHLTTRNILTLRKMLAAG